MCFNRNAKWCGKKAREPSSWLQLIISSLGGWEDDSGAVKTRPHWLWRGTEGRWVVWAACGVLGTTLVCIGWARWGAAMGGQRDSSANSVEPASRYIQLFWVWLQESLGGRTDNCSFINTVIFWIFLVFPSSSSLLFLSSIANSPSFALGGSARSGIAGVAELQQLHVWGKILQLPPRTAFTTVFLSVFLEAQVKPSLCKTAFPVPAPFASKWDPTPEGTSLLHGNDTALPRRPVSTLCK